MHAIYLAAARPRAAAERRGFEVLIKIARGDITLEINYSKPDCYNIKLQSVESR
jgi:hypothetical protein